MQETHLTTMLSLCFLITVCVAGVNGALPNLFQSVLLDEYVNTTGARCLDGTPVRYWIQQSPPLTSNHSISLQNRTKWVIHFMGGGWCFDVASCTVRAFQYRCYMGSSDPKCFDRETGNDIPGKKFAPVMDLADIPSILGARWGGGLMINDPLRNPFTYDWNKVELHYCDGGSFTGNNETVTRVDFNGSKDLPLYFRGQRNFDAVMTHLVRTYGLGDATDIILSGDSAGGMAVFLHADHLQTFLPSSRVVAVPDSGFFFADLPAAPQWPRSIEGMALAMNSSLDPFCVAAVERNSAVKCIRPDVASQYIHVPTFVMNSIFDPALDEIIENPPEDGKNVTNVRRIGQALVQRLNETLLSRQPQASGAFLTGCHEHCGQWGTGQGGLFPDYNVSIDGYNGVCALQEWWETSLRQGGQAGRRLWIQQGEYPCANCC